MAGSGSGWKRFVPVEVTPLIAAMGVVTVLASYRLFTVSKQPEVRFTKRGGVHDWTDEIKEDLEKDTKAH